MAVDEGKSGASIKLLAVDRAGDDGSTGEMLSQARSDISKGNTERCCNESMAVTVAVTSESNSIKQGAGSTVALTV